MRIDLIIANVLVKNKKTVVNLLKKSLKKDHSPRRRESEKAGRFSASLLEGVYGSRNGRAFGEVESSSGLLERVRLEGCCLFRRVTTHPGEKRLCKPCFQHCSNF